MIGSRTAALGAWAFALLATALGCKKGDAQAGPLAADPAAGRISVRPLAKGFCADLRVSPDDQHLAFLLDPQKPRMEGLPPQQLSGELEVAPVSGGPARRLGSGVTNVPGGYAFSPDGRWILFLAGYNAVSQEGRLFAADLSDPKSEPIPLGKEVTYVAMSADSRWLALIDGGVLKMGSLARGPFAEVAGQVATAAFSGNGAFAVFKRRLGASGSLHWVPVGQWDQAKKLADQVGDYAVSPDGKAIAFTQRSGAARGGYELFLARTPQLKLERVAAGVGRFAFSPDSRYLVRIEIQRPEEPEVGKFSISSLAGGPQRLLGERVQDFAFAPDSSAIAFLDSYHLPTRSGVMTVATLPDGAPKRLGYRVPYFTWGADGRYLAFSAGVMKPIFSLDLMLYRAGDEQASRILPWVFGYGFGPKDQYLLARASCVRSGRACDLYSLDLGKADQKPRKILEGVYSFKASKTGERLLVTYARTDADSFDLGAYNLAAGVRRTLDQKIKLPALFAAPDGSKAGYMVADAARAGVYLADPLP